MIDQELRRVKIRVPHLAVGAWAAPTIAAHGSPEQQERWVRPTLLGEIAWCQLFSEPEAGSDLAALTTTATRADGGWLLNGQKVWTSMAKEADWGICLVRTNPQAPKHLGITYVIVDMRSPGIDIRPLREMTGLEMFNEVFFDDVFVPDDCVIGEVDGGWPLARTTLANERVSMGSGSSFGGGIEALLGLVGERLEHKQLDADALLLDQLGGLVAEAHSVAVLGLRSTQRSVSGAKPGPEASVRKLLGVEHDQRTQELGLALLGPGGRHHHRRRRPVDLRLPRQPVPHHRRRHQRDPAQRDRRAPARPPARPRASRLMAEILPDQLRMMAERVPRRGRLLRRLHRDRPHLRRVGAPLEPAGALADRPGRGQGRPGGDPRAAGRRAPPSC